MPLPTTRLATLAFSLALPLQAEPLTLETVMAHPDWIGTPVEQVWWSGDAATILYTRKREGSPVREVFAQPSAGGEGRLLDAAARATADAAFPVFDADRTRMAFIRDGDVFVRDLRTQVLQPLTRDNEEQADLRFSTDGTAMLYRTGDRWWRQALAGGPPQLLVELKTGKAPGSEPPSDDLRDAELRLINTLARQRGDRDALLADARARRMADGSAAPEPVFLGEGMRIAGSLLSGDASHLLVVLEPAEAAEGRTGAMPRYINESGYEDTESVRTRVGRNPPIGQSLRLVDLRDGRQRELALDGLPGITEDPLAALRKAAGQPPLEGLRPLRVLASASGPDGRLVLQLRSVDNKDRWLVRVDTAKGSLTLVHHLYDAAWINWSFNEFGFLADGRLWWLSEENGYSHLAVEGRRKPLTEGRWEVSAPQLVADGQQFVFVCNRRDPGDYELCSVAVDGGEVRELTSVDGIEDFVLSPDGQKIALRWSAPFIPPQLGVVNTTGGEVRRLTDTRSPAFKGRPWRDPQFVQVPSSDGAGMIHGKLYTPERMEPGKRYPVVMFVHGAGYLQNVHRRWPVYFREQMFHQLLTEHGYLVLDLDFRASEGYGRDWRTAIYRRMGTPELQDYKDGLDWLVANHQADRDHAGIYGGSYGGFMSLMAMFKAPGLFQAGAALRPVTDWRHYNHEYTSNILDTPALGDQVYRDSSPIEHAEQLRGQLLIAHGMMDDNVLFQDSVRLAQRLIELKKPGWELAGYPLERHGYVQPEAWYDQYRRIFELMERTLKPATPSTATP